MRSEADILVLDEPTAAMDAQAEAEVFEHFRQLARGRITILISHRFSTVRMADQIVVLDRGRIVERGSHEELMRAERPLRAPLHPAGARLPLARLAGGLGLLGLGAHLGAHALVVHLADLGDRAAPVTHLDRIQARGDRAPVEVTPMLFTKFRSMHGRLTLSRYASLGVVNTTSWFSPIGSQL